MKEYMPQMIASAIAISVFYLSRYIVHKLIRKYGVLTRKPEGRMMQVRQIINIIFNITFVITMTIIWGLRPENLWIGLSSIFAVIGVAFFAQWSILSNITAGVIMFFSAPFRVGDRVHIMDKDIPITATIENIQTFYTHIRTDENELIVIPNNQFLQKTVGIVGGVDGDSAQ